MPQDPAEALGLQGPEEHWRVQSQKKRGLQRHSCWLQIVKVCSQLGGSSLVAQRLSVCLECGRSRFNPWVRKILWRRKWQPTPVFLPGESHGQRSLVGYSPWGGKDFPGGSDSEGRQCLYCLQCGRPGFDPWVWKIPWRRTWQSTPVLLPGKSQAIDQKKKERQTLNCNVRKMSAS